MKKISILIALFLLILTGCSSGNNLDKTYSIEQLSYKASSDWTYENDYGSNYHYLSDGSMLFASSVDIEVSTEEDKYDHLKNTYEGFASTADNFSGISENYDAVNHILTASYSGDYGEGDKLVNFYVTVNEDKIYCIAFMGNSYSEEQQNELFNQITDTVAFK